MKVLLISSSSGSHGGGEFYLVHLAQGLVRLGCDVTVLMSSSSLMDGLEEKFEGIAAVSRIELTNTYQRKTGAIGSILDRTQQRRIEQFICKHEPDVVHINKQCMDDGLGIVLGATKTKFPIAITVHVTRSMSQLGAKLGFIRDSISNRVLNRDRHQFITVSKTCGEDLAANLNDTALITPVFNGAEPPEDSDRTDIRKSWNLDSDAVILGTVARIEEQKNPLFMVPVLKSLPEHVHMVWVGDGRLRRQLEDAIASEKIEDRFHLLGWQDNAKNLIPGFDIFVLPSLFEGFPFAIIEAMASGIPSVVSDVDGNGESNLHEKSGYVLPLNDTASWVEHLQELVDQPKLRDDMGKFARDRFQNEYTIDVMAKRTMDVYRKAIERSSSV